MVIITSSLKPLQKRTIPNSHTSNSFIKECIKLSALPRPLVHAVHLSCSFQSAPLIKEVTLSRLWRTFPTSARYSKWPGKQQCLNCTGWLLQESDMLQGQHSPRARALPAHTFCANTLCLSLGLLCQLSSCWALEKPSLLSHITVTPSGTISSGSAADQERSY